MNYSVDTLKKAAFHDELENVLKVLVAEDPLKVNMEIVLVMEYLQKRLKQIEIAYK